MRNRNKKYPPPYLGYPVYCVVVSMRPRVNLTTIIKTSDRAKFEDVIKRLRKMLLSEYGMKASEISTLSIRKAFNGKRQQIRYRRVPLGDFSKGLWR